MHSVLVLVVIVVLLASIGSGLGSAHSSVRGHDLDARSLQALAWRAALDVDIGLGCWSSVD